MRTVRQTTGADARRDTPRRALFCHATPSVTHRQALSVAASLLQMISLNEEVTIPSPPDAVWPMLRDPALVASCIPGAALTAAGEDGAYQGTIRVKFGPTVATFRGEAKLAYDDAARRCTIEGRGIDGRGASRALASGVVTASGAETTTLKCEGNFNVTGPLETFANAGGGSSRPRLVGGIRRQHGTARRGSRASPGNRQRPLTPALSPRCQARERSEPEPAPGRRGRIARRSATWRAFLGWFKQIFFAKRKMR